MSRQAVSIGKINYSILNSFVLFHVTIKQLCVHKRVGNKCNRVKEHQKIYADDVI